MESWMSQIEIERFFGRLITDAKFRARAAISLDNATNNEGITISKGEMIFLHNIDFLQFGQIAETLDDSIKRI